MKQKSVKILQAALHLTECEILHYNKNKPTHGERVERVDERQRKTKQQAQLTK